MQAISLPALILEAISPKITNLIGTAAALLILGGWKMARDPVCGMDIDEETAPTSINYKGQMYYFCSQACKERFEEELGEFLEESPPKGYSH
jgi:Cu+-exporting ATPase